jgi:hypothetical protein
MGPASAIPAQRHTFRHTRHRPDPDLSDAHLGRLVEDALDLAAVFVLSFEAFAVRKMMMDEAIAAVAAATTTATTTG